MPGFHHSTGCEDSDPTLSIMEQNRTIEFNMFDRNAKGTWRPI
jgi:hypothetical protein